MSKNATAVAEAFISGEYKAAGALVSHGDAIYSYALKLAYRDTDGGIVYTDAMADYLSDVKNHPQSRTTAGHIHAVHRATHAAYAARRIPSVGTIPVSQSAAKLDKVA